MGVECQRHGAAAAGRQGEYCPRRPPHSSVSGDGDANEEALPESPCAVVSHDTDHQVLAFRYRNIDICRRGFPLVPNFSTTIDGATGQTLDIAIPDLGDEFCTASQHAAMRGYIALSRVTSADSLLLAQPFNPQLFRLGPQAFPSLLFEVLQGKVPFDKLEQRCQEATRASKRSPKLKDELWECRLCKTALKWKAYFAPRTDMERDPEWQAHFSKYILRRGCLRECLSCRGEKLGKDDISNTLTCEDCGHKKTKESSWIPS